MTGPEHYRKAEALLRAAANRSDPEYGWMNASDTGTAECIARAQVHATLALAAAAGDEYPEVAT